jgi:hypothetical protein
VNPDHVCAEPAAKGPEESLGLPLRVAICLAALLVFTEVHELVHLAAGRLAGLPAHFLNLTAVGVEPHEAAQANPAALAWMNGAAPVASVLLGFLAFAVVTSTRRRFAPSVRYTLAWIAILGTTYAGLQLMITPAPIVVSGAGTDSAAVIGGYFEASPQVRAVIAGVGVVIYLASAFWLKRLFPQAPPSSEACPAPVAMWRRGLAAAIGILSIAGAVGGFLQLLRGNPRGLPLLMTSATLAWPAAVALLVPWRWPSAAAVWRAWLLPGLLVSLLLAAVGLVVPSDFATVATMQLVPLVMASWLLSRRGV